MSRFIFISLVTFATLPVALRGSAQSPSVLAVSESHNHSVVRAKVGDAISLNLRAQFGTGYSWVPDEQTKSQQVLRSSVGAGANGTLRTQPGGAEMQAFRFSAVKEGSVTLHYAYVQPWIHNAKPSKEFSVQVIVSSARNK